MHAYVCDYVCICTYLYVYIYVCVPLSVEAAKPPQPHCEFLVPLYIHVFYFRAVQGLIPGVSDPTHLCLHPKSM